MSRARRANRRFETGRLMITPGAMRALGLPFPGLINRAAVIMAQHKAGNWGDVCADDKRANDLALENGARLLSGYRIDPAKPYKGDNRVWIITEADRSVTTLILPDEY